MTLSHLIGLTSWEQGCGPGGLAGVGLAWCPASVDSQVRAFALQAAGIQCSVTAVPDPPPEVVSRARSQIREVCSRGAGFRVAPRIVRIYTLSLSLRTRLRLSWYSP